MATQVTRPTESGTTTAMLIELAGVEKVYRTGKLEHSALRGVDLSIAAGEMVAIVGPSGSGKSTIINMITGIDRPTAGSVAVGGERIDQLSEEQLASWRGENVGIVFQFFQLLPTLTALENAVLPLDFSAFLQIDTWSGARGQLVDVLCWYALMLACAQETAVGGQERYVDRFGSSCIRCVVGAHAIT